MAFNFQTDEDIRNTYITYLLVNLAQYEPFIYTFWSQWMADKPT